MSHSNELGEKSQIFGLTKVTSKPNLHDLPQGRLIEDLDQLKKELEASIRLKNRNG